MGINYREIISSVVLLPDGGGHDIVPISEEGEKNVFFVQNDRGTKYLVCAVSDDEQISVESEIRFALRESNTISVGVHLNRNGKVCKVIRKSFRTGDYDYIASFDVPNMLNSSVLAKPCDLKVLTERLENVLYEVHSAFRDVDGLHAPDALDEICKLIYAKVYDEENSLKTGFIVFQRYAYDSVEECAAEVRRLYRDAVEDDRAVFVNKIPSYERSRGVFRGQLLLSSPAIVRAVELLQYYSLSSSPVDIKGRAFQNVLLPSVRSGMGQYFTPKEVIDFVVDIMSPNVRELIIDPFCGSGHFLTSALDNVRRGNDPSSKVFHEFAFTRLHGVEKSDRMVRIAMTDMRLHGDGHSNVRCIDSLLPFDNYPDLYRETFDLLMTNPPFGVDLSPDSFSQLGPFSLVSGRRSSVSLEILALERSIQLLKPGGRMAIVLPDGVLSNGNTNYVREWLHDKVRVVAIISLPVETFSPFGANIKTSILVLRRLMPGEEPRLDSKVFLAEVGSVGYDAAGRLIGNNELDDVKNNFLMFIEGEGW